MRDLREPAGGARANNVRGVQQDPQCAMYKKGGAGVKIEIEINEDAVKDIVVKKAGRGHS